MEIFGDSEITIGASSDLKAVASLAREMVTRLGMSDLGNIALESDSEREVFLGRDWGSRSEYSEEMAVQIDRQVRQIVTHCYEEARRIIRDHRTLMDSLVEALLDQETLEGEDFRSIVKQFTQQAIKEPAYASSLTASSYTAEPQAQSLE